MAQTSPGARRRVTVARAHAAAQSVLRHAARLLSDHPDHADAGLLANCVEYGRIRRRRDHLSRTGRRGMDKEEWERADANLHGKGAAVLEHVTSRAAVTLDGHRARAAAILAWDEGELITLVDTYAILQDRLMLALLADLVGL